MPRNVSVTFADGTSHVYQGVPDDATPEQVEARARKDFQDKQIASLSREQIPQAPKTTIGGEVREFFKGIPTGAIGLGETAIAGASALLPEDYEKSVRESVGAGAAALKKPFQAAPGYEDTVGRKLGQAFGSTIPFFAAAPFGVPGLVAGATTGVAAGAGEARLRAEEKGATGDERAIATALGIGPGLFDIVAPQLKIGKTIIARALVRGGVEGATEAAQNVAQNLIAKGVYNPEQPILEGTAEEGAYGAGAGALASLLVDTVTGRRGSVRTTPTEAAALTEPAAPSAPDMGFKPSPNLPDTYAEAVQEVERLKREVQTSDIKARILELEAYKKRLLTEDIEGMRRKPEAEPTSLEDQIRNQTAMQGEFRETMDLPTQEPAAEEAEPVAEKEVPTVLDADTLNATGLPKQSGIYKQLLGKNLEDLADLDAVLQTVERAKTNKNLSPDTKTALEAIAGNAFNLYGRQAEMFGPRGGVLEPVKTPKASAAEKKIAEVTEGKDLTDPVQLNQVTEELEDYANAPTRRAEDIAKIDTFLDSLPSATPEATDVIESTEPVGAASEPSPAVAEQRGEAPAGGVEASEAGGVDVAGGVAKQPDVGAGVQPAALETPTEKLTVNQAAARLTRDMGLTPAEARAAVADLVDSFGQVSAADIDSYTQAMRRAASEVELKGADQHASDLGGRVVWQQGDTSLVRGYSALTGAPVYIGTKGNMRTRVDVGTYTGAMFTPEEKAAMSAAKQEVEQADTQAHKDNPFIDFTKARVQTSANTPKGLGEVVSGWAKLLGVKANIYVTTMEDARADADKYTGPHRAIGSAVLDPNNIGVMRRMADGSYYIAFTASSSKTAMLETLAHELGHIHMKEAYANANPTLQNTVRAAFDKWLMSQKNKTARELVDSLRAKTTAKGTEVSEGMTAMQLRQYWRSFDEWYADQVSRWATTDAEPVSVVEKFFARLGRALRNFFAKVQNQKYLADETFVQYLKEVRDSVADASPAESSGEVQAQKRTAEKATTLTPEGEAAAALNEQMKGISNPRPDGVDVVAKGLLGMHKFFNRGENDPSFRTYLRSQIADKDAPAMEKIHAKFDNKVVDYVTGKIRADLLVDQSQDYAAVAEIVLEKGAPVIGKDGLVEVVDSPDNMKNVFSIITDKLGKRLGSADLAMQIAHNAGIAKRADEINKRNEQLERQAEAAEAKKNFKAAKELRAAQVTVRASQAEIDAGLKALQMYPEINEALDMFTRYNNRLIDFLVASGRIDAATATNWKANTGYVPWTRVEEEVNAFEDTPVRGKVGLLNVGKLPILDRQGSTKEISNIFDNMIGHTSWVIRTGLTARAANALAEDLPDAKEIKSDDELQQELKKNRSRVIFTYKNGERTPYLLGSAADMPAFMIAPDVIPGIAKPFKTFADILRNFVTHMPAFALSQLVQDGTYRGMMLSGVEKPFSLPPKVFGNFYKILTGESDIAAELARLGVSGVYDGMPEHVISRAREKFGLKEKTAFQKAWGGLEKFSLAADLAVRSAIYEQTLAETKTDAMPEGDRALAYYRAKEYINFKRAGANPIVRGLRHVIPFMNAYIQGMDVLVRTMQGKGVSTADKRVAMQLFWATGAKLAALNVLYTLLVGDDDEYKGVDEYERAKNYIIPGTGLKLPVAPELGFMFKVVPELMTNYIISQGTERPDDAANVYRAMRDAFVNSYSGVNLTPQLIKPALEVAVNYSFFTSNPIVGQAMKNVDPAEQFTSSTSELSKFVGDMAGISPLKLDYLIRGYTGMLGAFVLDATDAVANPNRVEKPINKLPQVSTFMYDPTGRGYKSEFYRFRESVDRVVDTVNLFKREGRADELREYLTEDRLRLLAMRGVTGKIEDTLSRLRKYRNIVASDPNMSGEEKAEITQEVQAREKAILLAFNVPKLRQMAIGE